MKTLALIIAWLIMVLYMILGIAYFTGIWGAIGFFGAILTIPISTISFIGLMVFGSIWGAIVNIVILAIVAVCYNYAIED